jgi:hypothetical protein
MCDITALGERILLREERQRLRADRYVDFVEGLPSSVDFVEVVGGGEPLLLKDIELLFETIKNKPIRGSLITNGSLMNDEIIDTFVRTQWDDVRVSLDAASRDIYVKTHGIDQFDLVVDNIGKLLRARRGHHLPRVGIHFVIQRDNYLEICDFVQLANELGVDASFDTLISNDPSEGLHLRPDQTAAVVEQLQRAWTMVNAPLALGIGPIDRTLSGAVRSGLLPQRLRNLAVLVAAKRLGRESPGHSEARISIDWVQSLLAESEQAGSRSEYVEDKYCSLVQHQLEVRSNGMVIPCCMAQSLGTPEIMITKGSVKEIWDAYGDFRDELRQGKFRSFCVDKCNYRLPERN